MLVMTAAPATTLPTLGRLVVTAQINSICNQNDDFSGFVATSISRHVRCDWGDLDEEDRQLNDDINAARDPDGQRLFSGYSIPNSIPGSEELPDGKIWIVTDAPFSDDPITTVLFPSDY